MTLSQRIAALTGPDRAPYELNKGDLPDVWLGYCNGCSQPINRETWLARARDWFCYRLTMAWPVRWMPWSLLPYAGRYAHSCHCENRKKARGL